MKSHAEFLEYERIRRRHPKWGAAMCAEFAEMRMEEMADDARGDDYDRAQEEHCEKMVEERGDNEKEK